MNRPSTANRLLGMRPCFATKGPSVQIRSPPPRDLARRSPLRARIRSAGMMRASSFGCVLLCCHGVTAHVEPPQKCVPSRRLGRDSFVINEEVAAAANRRSREVGRCVVLLTGCSQGRVPLSGGSRGRGSGHGQGTRMRRSSPTSGEGRLAPQGSCVHVLSWGSDRAYDAMVVRNRRPRIQGFAPLALVEGPR